MVLSDVHRLAFTVEQRLVELVAVDGLVERLADTYVHQRAIRILPARVRILGILHDAAVVPHEGAQAWSLTAVDWEAATLGIALEVRREVGDVDLAGRERGEPNRRLTLETELELREIALGRPC